jgi:glycosyltransferase involved in cell wall biosynthesis
MFMKSPEGCSTIGKIRRLRELNIALVHDWLNQSGGAENVLEEMVALFPEAPVYTSMYAPQRMPAAYRHWDIRTSFMQRLPGVATRHQAYLPLYPLAFATTDLRSYDLVISNKSGFCHGVKTGSARQKARSQGRAQRAPAVHVCYCLTPARYLWLFDQYRKREQLGSGISLALYPMLALLRRWDWAAAQGVDHFIAISTTVQQRIRTIYGRESVIIHPPVDTEFFTPDSTPRAGDFFLIVSRLVPYKRIDLAVQAFRRLPRERLVIIGEGRDLASLQAQASENVSFLGRQGRATVRELLRQCKAFLFPGLEDFGIAPVEALSCGRPVIAFGEGGALDTVTPGATGELFAAQTCDSLLDVLASFDARMYDPALCRAQAEQFSIANFRRKLLAYLSEKIVHSS